MKHLVALQHKNEFYKNVTKVEWFIGLLCNFSCTYCAEYARSGYGDTEKILRGIDLLHQKVGTRKLFLLLGGGEPSIHPGIKEIVKYIASKNIHLSMISNGSRPPALYVEMLEYISSYTFSVHFEQKYERTLETIFTVDKKIKELNANCPRPKYYMQANIMMVPGYFDQIREVIQRLEAAEIKYIIRRVRPLFNEADKPVVPEKIKNRQTFVRDFTNAELVRSDYGYYDEAELTFLRQKVFAVEKNTEEFWYNEETNQVESNLSNSNDVSLRKLNKFHNWKCWIGIERLHIYPNGDVFRNTCKVGGRLGNIYEDFHFPQDPVICDKHRCTCAWAINVSKARNISFENRLRIAQDMVGLTQQT